MASSLLLTTQRQQPVLVPPAEATPHDMKPLSDIDDQQGLYFHVCCIHFFRDSPSMAGRDPVGIIRDALARALVYYYPLAGRLRGQPGGKLLVECTGEGALFVEADANVRIDHFGPEPQPPFPFLQDLIYGADSSSFLESPLLTVQVTRLECGGFVLGHRVNHVVADAAGFVQVVKAISEIARGFDAPTVRPVWARELLMARDPPVEPTHAHPAYDPALQERPVSGAPTLRMFFFGPTEIAALRRHLPPQLQSKATRFDLLAGCLWRCRTAALSAAAGGDGDGDEVRLRFVLNARDKCDPPLPAGYYGNGFAYAVAKSTAGELRRNQLGYAVELVREAKGSITDGYMQSAADFLALNGRPAYTTARTFQVSDLTRLGFDGVDFGWGEAVYGGPAVGGGRVAPRRGSYFIRFKSNGEDGILVPVNLPAPAMDAFVVEMQHLTKETPVAAPMKVEVPHLDQLVGHAYAPAAPAAVECPI